MTDISAAIEAATRPPIYSDLDITPPSHSIYRALKEGIEHLRSRAPEDHDLLVIAHNVLVENVHFRDPDTFVFSGLDGDGHRSIVFIHYTQLVAQVISRPKAGPERVITGFAPIQSEEE